MPRRSKPAPERTHAGQRALLAPSFGEAPAPRAATEAPSEDRARAQAMRQRSLFGAEVLAPVTETAARPAGDARQLGLLERAIAKVRADTAPSSLSATERKALRDPAGL